jgi:predicted GH43/DUF377 family glycosyl hydrolase/nucleotide-binding universal stress UspA family protein/CBS domain-containing protein
MTPDPGRLEEAWGVLNPASARSHDGELYLFPRVVAEGNYSRIAIARVIFDADGDPAAVERLGLALEPRESYEIAGANAGGVEDPRISYVPLLDSYIMTYTALGPTRARIALAVSKDLHSWDRLGLLHFESTDGVDLNRCDNKDCVIFPLPVMDPAGRAAFALLHRPIYLVSNPDGTTEWQLPPGVTDRRPSIWISYVPVDHVKQDIGELTRVSNHRLLAHPVGSWEYHHIGSGAPPILTEEGWLLYYHGVLGATWAGIEVTPGSLVYQSGVMLLDRENPGRVLYRSSRPVLLPEEGGELEGIVPNVVFPTAVDVRGQRIDVYYGAADERVAAATTTITSSVLLGPSAPPGEHVLHHVVVPRGLSRQRQGEGVEDLGPGAGSPPRGHHRKEGGTGMQVKEIMTEAVEVIDPGMALAEAAERMRALDIGMMPVQDGDEVVGVITDRDMAMRAIARGLDPNTATVGEGMTPEIVFCYEDQSLEEAADEMADSHLRRLLVLDRANRLVGIISLDDVAGRVSDPELAVEALVRASSRSERMRPGYRRILVALDGSEFAESVLPAIESLGQKFGSTVTLLRAVSPVQSRLVAEVHVGAVSTTSPAAGTVRAIDERRGEALTYLTDVEQRLRVRGLTVDCEAPVGPASEVILRRARQLGADLIAITTHGRTGVDRVLLGSVAEDVLRRAPCLVLLARVQHRRDAKENGRGQGDLPEEGKDPNDSPATIWYAHRS